MAKYTTTAIRPEQPNCPKIKALNNGRHRLSLTDMSRFELRNKTPFEKGMVKIEYRDTHYPVSVIIQACSTNGFAACFCGLTMKIVIYCNKNAFSWKLFTA